MTDYTNQDWPYPGSRWLMCDFHIHPPASAETPWARGNTVLSPEDWLLGYMAAGVDRVAVTDHDSDAWTDGCRVEERGALQEEAVREEVCRVMEGGREAFSRRWARLGREV